MIDSKLMVYGILCSEILDERIFKRPYGKTNRFNHVESC
ncbi:MAG: hypothetical protein FD133_765 [Erysipelotrichaceae bacterium]|nr:MAG: hypothetical protein FD179_1206 [Erysipelotrichaceae bacterium]TXT18606.1 MAG: hypothetical protein FD133_765 [Erysipelotrichaceae bacterium]